MMRSSRLAVNAGFGDRPADSLGDQGAGVEVVADLGDGRGLVQRRASTSGSRNPIDRGMARSPAEHRGHGYREESSNP
jgi:hypothetical protein